MLELDFNPKIVHVAVRDIGTIVIDYDYDIDNRGFIYVPKEIFSPRNLVYRYLEEYNDFFVPGAGIQVVPLHTEQGPGELAKCFKKKFGADLYNYVGGVLAYFRATEEQASVILTDLRANHQNYYESLEKKKYALSLGKDSPIRQSSSEKQPTQLSKRSSAQKLLS